MAYPIEKEQELQAKSRAGRSGGKAITKAKTEAARSNGAIGGRPKTQSETQSKTQSETQSETKPKPKVNPTERKGKEEERKGKEEEPRARTAEAVLVPAPDQKTVDEMDLIAARDQATNAKVNSEPLKITWQDWRLTRRIGIARTGEDGDVDAWKLLWNRAGKEIMNEMYAALEPNLGKGKCLWYSTALAWINDRYEDK
jgi:hypothetical protein